MAGLNVRIRMSPGLVRWALMCLLLAAAPVELSCETFTLSTYYPPPVGVYARMITTGRTYLAQGAAGVVVGGSSAAAGDLLTVNGASTFNGPLNIPQAGSLSLYGFFIPLSGLASYQWLPVTLTSGQNVLILAAR